MRIVILAQGSQTRLAGVLDHPKQLLRLSDGRTILDRTLDQLRAYCEPVEASDAWRAAWPAVVVAAWDDAWEPLRGRADVEPKILAEPGSTVLNGLWQVTDAYNDDLVVVLGDVVFSHRAIDAVYHYATTDRLRYFGRRSSNPITGKPYGELFAVTIPKSHRTSLRFVLSHLSGGKLWDLLRLVERNDADPNTVLVDIDDYTDDVDTPEDLEMVWPKLCAAVVEDR